MNALADTTNATDGPVEPIVPTVELPRLKIKVLAKNDPRFGLSAKTFTNAKQAFAAADRVRALGVATNVVQPGFGPVFYVEVSR